MTIDAELLFDVLEQTWPQASDCARRAVDDPSGAGRRQAGVSHDGRSGGYTRQTCQGQRPR